MLCIYQENSNKNAKPQRKEQSDRIVAKHQSSSDMRLVAGILKRYNLNLWAVSLKVPSCTEASLPNISK